jgi:hypothetical protein
MLTPVRNVASSWAIEACHTPWPMPPKQWLPQTSPDLTCGCFLEFHFHRRPGILHRLYTSSFSMNMPVFGVYGHAVSQVVSIESDIYLKLLVLPYSVCVPLPLRVWSNMDTGHTATYNNSVHSVLVNSPWYRARETQRGLYI